MTEATWTCTGGARGRVVGPGIDVAATVTQVAPTSIRVLWEGGAVWFRTDPGRRYLVRMGDTADQPWRFVPGTAVTAGGTP